MRGMGATAIIVVAITAAGILWVKSLTEALFYAQTIEKLLAAQKENDGMQITKIVITGGPCAGKTTGMGRIQKEFVKLGYKVLFVPETATELITGGVAPWTLVSNEEYQKCQISLQKRKEEIFEQAAGKMGAEKVLIVCDRGVMDNRAYMNDLEFENVMRALGLHEVEERDQYDAVFHLNTAAKGRPPDCGLDRAPPFPRDRQFHLFRGKNEQTGCRDRLFPGRARAAGN